MPEVPSGPSTAPTAPSLTSLLRRRIAEEGPITFAQFMEAALYDPSEGFYSRASVGEGGDFVTSPHVSPVFGLLVARQIEEFWDLLGRPDPFVVVEAGAGDGTLTRQILSGLSPDVRTRTRYVAVDRSAAARVSLETIVPDVAASLDDVRPAPAGCLIANELLDNLPFHRVRATADGPVELYVGVREDQFELVSGPLSSPRLAGLVPPLRSGMEVAVSPAAFDFLDRATALFGRGYVWLVDYGIGSGEEPPPVHGYRGHRIERDVLEDPGSRDITAGVDMQGLAGHARARGLAVWGPVAQRDALLALGFREVEGEARGKQAEAISARRGIDALRIYSNRNRAKLLLSTGGLGSFPVLCVGVGVDEAPRSVRGFA
jgi:SAM-dependent MidA family methyltransferase